MSIEQNIQKKEFERRLHILKGFTNIEEVATVEIQQLEKAVGTENIYDYSGLQKLTNDVLTKRNQEEIFKAKKFMSELTPISIIGENKLPCTVFIEKGNMEFVNKKPNLKNKNPNLIRKKVIDKRGYLTTRWVKNGEDKKSDDENDKQEEQSNEGQSNTNRKPPKQWVVETSTEDLQNYLLNSNNNMGELALLAKEELKNRGIKNSDENKNKEERGKEEQSVDYNDPESITSFIKSNPKIKEAIVNMMIEDPSLSASQALRLYQTSNTDNSETHAKIDATQAALDKLKSHTNHPDS